MTQATTSVKPSTTDGSKMSRASLSAEELRKLDAYWRASNYLSVGQIYLLDNPLLKEPLKREHIKPRLLGHWGTSPGLNMLCVHLNRVIKRDDLSMIYIIGPGHGGPSLVAHAYLEGTYSEVYPNISQDAEGMKRLFKQFSFPGGIPSHVAPETPGSIHEGGELGYALSHAYGAAFDNPDLIVACVVGDGEAETGPLATGWHGNKFLNPVRDGCVLPILHLNGYKIANPCFLARIPKDELKKFFEGMGYKPYFVEGRDAEAVHQQLARVLDLALAEIKEIWADARTNGAAKLPDFRDYAVKVPSPGATTAESARVMGKFLRDVMKQNLESKNFRLFSPDENNSNRWQDVLEVTNRCYMADIYPEDDHLSPDGRVMEVLSEHQCQGWLEGYLLTA